MLSYERLRHYIDGASEIHGDDGEQKTANMEALSKPLEP